MTQLTERDYYMYMKNNPKGMRNRWRRRVEKSVEKLKKTSDFNERRRLKRSIDLQKKRLRYWENKVK